MAVRHVQHRRPFRYRIETYDGVVDNVSTLSTGKLHYLLLPIFGRVVQGVVCTSLFDTNLALALRRCRGNDFATHACRVVHMIRQH